jgi:hypothetical protein
LGTPKTFLINLGCVPSTQRGCGHPPSVVYHSTRKEPHITIDWQLWNWPIFLICTSEWLLNPLSPSIVLSWNLVFKQAADCPLGLSRTNRSVRGTPLGLPYFLVMRPCYSIREDSHKLTQSSSSISFWLLRFCHFVTGIAGNPVYTQRNFSEYLMCVCVCVCYTQQEFLRFSEVSL